MKILLGNKKEVEVVSLVQNYSKELEITFAETVAYDEVRKLYDPFQNPSFSKELIDRMEVFSDDGASQGVHYGYNEPTSITAFNGVLKVVLKQESEHERLTKATDTKVSVSSEDNLVNMELLMTMDDKLNTIIEHLQLDIMK